MLNIGHVPSLPIVSFVEDNEILTDVAITEGKNLVEIITNAFSGMLTGTLGGVKAAFDSVVLNDAKTGLSMLAIWSLVFAGIGLVPRGVHWTMSFFRGKRTRI